MASDKTRPVRLQVNNSGAWKDVVRFDAGDTGATDKVTDAVEMLGPVDPKVTWRIATDDGLQTVLFHYSASSGWKAR